jgi:UDP-N-acetylmuramyl pentapeptide phosphotransferase/UDP-N-acetylglucosamine-1-phosphate transferase
MQIDIILPYLLVIPFFAILLIYLWNARFRLKWRNLKNTSKGELLLYVLAFSQFIYVYFEDQYFGVDNSFQLRLAIIVCAFIVLIFGSTEPKEAKE